MLPFILRKLLASIPVYLGIVLIMMAALRINDPVSAYLGKNATLQTQKLKSKSMGLDEAFLWQYGRFMGRVVTLDFGSDKHPYRSWQHENENVGEMLGQAVIPSLLITVPTLVFTSAIAIFVGMICAYFRGTLLDRTLMLLTVLGMSVSVVVFIVLGQTVFRNAVNGAVGHELFANNGYDPSDGWWWWIKYCSLPTLIGVAVGVGYDARFYRAVMVEETGRDYVTTALAKGATKPKIMFAHMLKNAMIPVITRLMITIPYLVTGSIVMEVQFRIPGMGKALIDALMNKDFPVIQVFGAVFALIFIVTNILTDVIYALVDPRVRLS